MAAINIDTFVSTRWIYEEMSAIALGMLTFFCPKTYAASPKDLLYCTGLIPPNDSLILSSLYQWM